MKDNPYINFPPLERKPDGTPYRMTSLYKVFRKYADKWQNEETRHKVSQRHP